MKDYKLIDITIDGEKRGSIYYIFSGNNMLNGGWLNEQISFGCSDTTLMCEVKENIEKYFKRRFNTKNVTVKGLY